MVHPPEHPGDPLHGVTLERMLNELVDHYGWAGMARRIPVRCFASDPSISSSLKFLRRTPWARAKVEALYVGMARRPAGESPGPARHDSTRTPMREPESGTAEVDRYIDSFSEPVKATLAALRATIREAAPAATEKMSYGVPTFYLHGNLVHFAAFRKHIGFYPAPSAMEAFDVELGGYKRAKGSVQFPIGEPLPLPLVSRMVAFRVAENERKAAGRRK